jgi:hypothetical protein
MSGSWQPQPELWQRSYYYNTAAPGLYAWALFFYLGYAARLDQERCPDRRRQPHKHGNRPIMGRLFYAVILWASRRLYKRTFSRCYTRTRNASKRRCGHSTAAGRQSRRAVLYRPEAGRGLEMIHPGLWKTVFGRFSGLFLRGSIWQKIGSEPKSCVKVV